MIRKALALTVSVGFLTACSSATPEGDGTGPIKIAATTNVWGSVVEFIGGDMVEVTNIIDQPNIDPHSYEPAARDLLAVQDSEVVLVNGGGYDSFMDGLIGQVDGELLVLRAVEGEGDHDHGDHDHAHEDGEEHDHAEGEEHAHEDGEEHDHAEGEEHTHEDGEEHDHAEGEEHTHEDGEEHHHAEGEGHTHAHDGNEHVWYDFHVVEEVADQVLMTLTQLRPDSAGQFQANHETFVEELEVQELRLEALRERALGYGVFSLTPLASIMIEEAGLDEYAPSELLEAVEEERDIPPSALADAEEVFKNPDVLMIITNDQVTDTQMQSIADMGADSGLPVVGLSELIPNEEWDYLDWMANNLDVLQSTVFELLPEQIVN